MKVKQSVILFISVALTLALLLFSFSQTLALLSSTPLTLNDTKAFDLDWNQFEVEAVKRRFPKLASEEELRRANDSEFKIRVISIADADGDYVFGHSLAQNVQPQMRGFLMNFTHPDPLLNRHFTHLLTPEGRGILPTAQQCSYLFVVHAEREPVLFHSANPSNKLTPKFFKVLRINAVVNSKCQYVFSSSAMPMHRMLQRRTAYFWTDLFVPLRTVCLSGNHSGIPSLLDPSRYNVLCAVENAEFPADGMSATLACVGRVFAIFHKRPEHLRRVTVALLLPRPGSAYASLVTLLREFLSDDVRFALLPHDKLVLLPNLILPCMSCVVGMSCLDQVITRYIWPKVNAWFSQSIPDPSQIFCYVSITGHGSITGRSFNRSEAFDELMRRNGITCHGLLSMSERMYRSVRAEYIIDSFGSNSHLTNILMSGRTKQPKRLVFAHSGYGSEIMTACRNKTFCCWENVILVQLPHNNLSHFTQSDLDHFINFTKDGKGKPLLCK